MSDPWQGCAARRERLAELVAAHLARGLSEQAALHLAARRLMFEAFGTEG